MPKKSESVIALDEKVDLARTLVRFRHRREAARELNEIESDIKETHDAEVADGSWTQLDLESIGVQFLRRGLPSGENSAKNS